MKQNWERNLEAGGAVDLSMESILCTLPLDTEEQYFEYIMSYTEYDYRSTLALLYYGEEQYDLLCDLHANEVFFLEAELRRAYDAEPDFLNAASDIISDEEYFRQIFEEDQPNYYDGFGYWE